jgi:hypothetical protein
MWESRGISAWEVRNSNRAMVATTWVLGYPRLVFIFGMPPDMPYAIRHMSRFAKIGAR